MKKSILTIGLLFLTILIVGSFISIQEEIVNIIKIINVVEYNNLKLENVESDLRFNKLLRNNLLKNELIKEYERDFYN